MNVNNLLEGANPYKALQDQAGKLAGKWERFASFLMFMKPGWVI